LGKWWKEKLKKGCSRKETGHCLGRQEKRGGLLSLETKKKRRYPTNQRDDNQKRSVCCEDKGAANLRGEKSKLSKVKFRIRRKTHRGAKGGGNSCIVAKLELRRKLLTNPSYEVGGSRQEFLSRKRKTWGGKIAKSDGIKWYESGGYHQINFLQIEGKGIPRVMPKESAT